MFLHTRLNIYPYFAVVKAIIIKILIKAHTLTVASVNCKIGRGDCYL